MSDLLWHLPGPRLFLQRTIEYLRDGCSLLIETERDSDAASPSLAEQIAAELARIGAAVCAMAANGNKEPRFALVQNGLLENELATDAEICDSLGSHRIIVDNRQQAQCPWVALTRRLRHLIRQRPAHERPTFVVVCQPQPANAGPRNDVSLKTLNWDNALTHSDMLALADALRSVREGQPDIIRKLLVHVAAHLCGNDIERLEELSRKNSAELLQVSREDTRDLLWRAQIEALFPWIEERRVELLPDVRYFLPEKHEGVSRDDLEIGQLAHLCSQNGSKGRPPVFVLRKIYALQALRNKLAHRKPVSEKEILNCSP
jgi:hypothetical protein